MEGPVVTGKQRVKKELRGETVPPDRVLVTDL